MFTHHEILQSLAITLTLLFYSTNPALSTINIAYYVDIFLQCMETNGGEWYDGLKLRVPLRIAATLGKNWGHMKEFE